MSRVRRSDLIILATIVGFVVIILFLSTRGGTGRSEAAWTGGSGVGLVEITGVIWDVRNWVEQIDEFRLERSVKAIVVRMESPGGGVAASQELYEALRRARAVKPVIASFGGVAASGAYYAALGADSIVANPGSTTGSIGVMIEFTRLGELLGKIGIENEVIKSGPFKDSGNPSREMNDEERAVFQGYIDDAFAQFSDAVATERGLTAEEVAEVADGRVFTGRQALELGLVDILGDLHAAVAVAGEMAGLEQEPSVIKPRSRRDLRWLERVLDNASTYAFERLESRSAFQYRWKVENSR